MAKKSPEALPSPFPSGDAQPALRAFAGAGCTQLNQLANVCENDLASLHAMGPKAIRLLRAALIESGEDFLS
jgi:hypothetical protein